MTPGFDTDVAYAGQSTEIGLNVQNASPPTQTYVGKDDSLWVGAAVNTVGLVVTLNARYLMPNGTIQLNQYTLRFALSRAMTYQQITLPEAFLLSVAATCNLQPGGGASAFVEVLLSRFSPSLFNASQVLCQGYINFNQPVSWPGGVNSTSVDCAGLPRSIGGTTPAAGADISDSVPANAKWGVVSAFFKLVTSAAVANRTLVFVIDDGVNIVQTVVINIVIPAVTTWNISIGQTLQNITLPASGVANACMPLGVNLFPLWRLRTLTTGLQAGDQYSNITYGVQEWLLP